MSKVFISYRREDSAATCGRIYDRLVARFGKDAVFKDVDSIPLGVRFPEYISGVMEQCGVELVIIGPHWLDIAESGGRRRLDNPDDLVRIEVESGISRDTVVIPVLVQGATMPQPDSLPGSLRALVTYNGVPIRYDPDFDNDMRRLVGQIERRIGSDSGAPPSADSGSTAANPNDPAAVLARQLTPRIEAAFSAQDWQAVVDQTDYLVRRAPDATPTAIYGLQGQALLQIGHFDAARAAFEAAIAHNPADMSLLKTAAQAFQSHGRYAESAPILRDLLALEHDPSARLDILRQYVGALTADGQWQEVLRRAEDGLRLAPSDMGLQEAKVKALLELGPDTGREAEALDLLRELTASPDVTARLWLTRARVAYKVGGYSEEVRNALKAAMELTSADDPSVLEMRLELTAIPSDRFPKRLSQLGYVSDRIRDVEFIVPPLCPMVVGAFWMGADRRSDSAMQKDSEPQHPINLPAFQIARNPVTVAEYACYVRAGHNQPTTDTRVDWQTQLQRLDHPVVGITWYDAMTYAKWLAILSGQLWRLPTEAEWEMAAKWDASTRLARRYPWGGTFEAARCNTNESGQRTTTPVGTYVSGRSDGSSPCGAQDMAGNVWEWTHSLYKPYPYSATDGREFPDSIGDRVLRGGSWNEPAEYALAARRVHSDPHGLEITVGFRLVLASSTVP